jgi:hypothetical protein
MSVWKFFHKGEWLKISQRPNDRLGFIILERRLGDPQRQMLPIAGVAPCKKVIIEVFLG